MVEAAQWIVRERGQVDDRLEPGEVGGPDVADVAEAPDNAARLGAEVAAAVEVGVEALDVVPAGREERREHRPDVAEMTGDEDSHTLEQTLLLGTRESTRLSSG